MAIIYNKNRLVYLILKTFRKTYLFFGYSILLMKTIKILSNDITLNIVLSHSIYSGMHQERLEQARAMSDSCSLKWFSSI